MQNQPDFAQDFDELFDVVTASGEPTGRVKRRADVHRDGDWHRSIHVWVYGVEANAPFLLMNQRGLEKDTWPGVLDATVGGHLSAGETVEEAYREIEEEIGIVADPKRLRHIGARARSAESAEGIIDREIEEVFLSHPFGELLVSLAGIGPRTGARILAEIGDGSRFANGSKLASYAGLAPVTRQSGTSLKGESKSRRGNHRLKNAMFLAAFASLRDPESKTFYDRKRAEGKKHNAALICLARR